MTAGFVEQLRQLGEQTTPAPWRYVHIEDDSYGNEFFMVKDSRTRGGQIQCSEDCYPPEQEAANSQFIVAARNLWEPLLAVVEASKWVIDEASKPGSDYIFDATKTLETRLAELGRAVEAAEKEAGQ